MTSSMGKVSTAAARKQFKALVDYYRVAEREDQFVSGVRENRFPEDVRHILADVVKDVDDVDKRKTALRKESEERAREQDCRALRVSLTRNALHCVGI